MLITFSCDAHENVTMFGGIALQLIKMMGQSGTVPSAILAENVSEALGKLQRQMSQQKPSQLAKKIDDDDSDEQEVSLGHRALPLIQLLKAAIQQNCDVMWA